MIADEKKRRSSTTSTAASDTVNGIIELIQAEGLGPGDQLQSEGVLAERFGVSRGTVRESVRALAQIGVLTVSNGRRPELAPINGKNIAVLINHAVQTAQVSVLQTWDLRQTLETRSVYLACLRRTDEQIARMNEIVDEMRVSVDDVEKLTDLDIRLHLLWAEAAANPLFLLVQQSLELVMRWTGPVGYAALGEFETVREHIELHGQISDAIARRATGTAVEKITEHFNTARNCIIDSGFE